MSDKDAYEVLMEGLGFPGSKYLRAIFEESMTPDQAEMAAALPATPEEVAEKTGFDIGRVKETLDELFFKGLIFPRGDFRNRTYYRFGRSWGELQDSLLATLELDIERDQRLCELVYDFNVNETWPRNLKRLEAQTDRPRLRIVPAYNAIKGLPGVLPYENFPEMLKAQERIGTVPCPCRLKFASVGDPCITHDDEQEHPACIQLNRGADYVVARGSGRELGKEEALELSDHIEEAGLLHIWPNSSVMIGPTSSCQCCVDCCSAPIVMREAGMTFDKNWEKSRYQAYVIPDDCTGCQACVDRCLFDAIDMVRPEGSKKYKAIVDMEKCFGCGNCVLSCEYDAIKMKVVRPPEHIPAPVAR